MKVLGIDTMQRMGDLLDLRKEDRRGNWIEIRDSKNGTADEVPLSPRAARTGVSATLSMTLCGTDWTCEAVGPAPCAQSPSRHVALDEITV